MEEGRKRREDDHSPSTSGSTSHSSHSEDSDRSLAIDEHYKDAFELLEDNLMTTALQSSPALIPATSQYGSADSKRPRFTPNPYARRSGTLDPRPNRPRVVIDIPPRPSATALGKRRCFSPSLSPEEERQPLQSTSRHQSGRNQPPLFRKAFTKHHDLDFTNDSDKE